MFGSIRGIDSQAILDGLRMAWGSVVCIGLWEWCAEHTLRVTVTYLISRQSIEWCEIGSIRGVDYQTILDGLRMAWGSVVCYSGSMKL